MNSICPLCPDCESSSFIYPFVIASFGVASAILTLYWFSKSEKTNENQDPYKMTTEIGLEYYRNLYEKIIHSEENGAAKQKYPVAAFYRYFTELYEQDSKMAIKPGANFLVEKHAGYQRFNNPLAMHTRVKLDNPDFDDDYIHANIVDFPNGLKMIMTGGPQREKPGQKSDIGRFWWMAKQEGVEKIVALCSPVEEGVLQFDQYHPDKENQFVKFDGLIVECIDKTMCFEGRIAMRKLSIKFEGHLKFYVTHYEMVYCKENNQMAVLDTIYVMLYEIRTSFTPVIVHCSDGIKLTGCFGFVEMGFQILKRGKELVLGDVLDYMRSKRAGVVTSAKGYGFCAYMLAYYIYVDKIHHFQNPEDKLIFDFLTTGFEGWDDFEKKVQDAKEKCKLKEEQRKYEERLEEGHRQHAEERPESSKSDSFRIE